ncbi:MAG: hypothetical protein D6B25_15235 [Desulfobulbaceae bacterium]|nr:MAG: hypothetical protein D6B25_15235 [Desulfobulbaceae bacterium]
MISLVGYHGVITPLKKIKQSKNPDCSSAKLDDFCVKEVYTCGKMHLFHEREKAEKTENFS